MITKPLYSESGIVKAPDVVMNALRERVPKSFVKV